MDKIAYSKLLDYYGNLLTSYQKEILRQYYDCDMSLFEIAEEYQISRQAVNDVLKRASEKLRDTDEKLKVIESSERVVKSLESFYENYLINTTDEEKSEFLKIIKSAREI